MKYLLLLNTPDDGLPAELAAAEYADTYARYSTAMGAMAQAGVLIECSAAAGLVLGDHGAGP